MSIAQSLLPEFDHEMANTRRILEVVPAADAAWRPHPKSTPLGDLAAHIAVIPSYARLVLQQTELDVGSPTSTSITRAPFTTVSELLARFDLHVRDSREALASATDAEMGQSWSLRNRGTTVFSLPRAAVLRGF